MGLSRGSKEVLIVLLDRVIAFRLEWGCDFLIGVEELQQEVFRRSGILCSPENLCECIAFCKEQKCPLLPLLVVSDEDSEIPAIEILQNAFGDKAKVELMGFWNTEIREIERFPKRQWGYLYTKIKDPDIQSPFLGIQAIDEDRFQNLYRAYRLYMEAISPGESIFNNGYHRGVEEKKLETCKRARLVLDAEAWTREMVGTHEIFDKTNAALREYVSDGFLDRRDVFEENYSLRGATDSEVGRLEGILYGLYKNQVDDALSTKFLIGSLGENYLLIFCLLFLKDAHRYVQVDPSIIEDALEEMGVDLRLRKSFSWDSYSNALNCLDQVGDLFSGEGICDVTRSEVYSFLWTIRSKGYEAFHEAPFSL